MPTTSSGAASESLNRDAVFFDIVQRMQSMWSLRSDVTTAIADQRCALEVLLQPYEKVLNIQMTLDDFI